MTNTYQIIHHTSESAPIMRKLYRAKTVFFTGSYRECVKELRRYAGIDSITYGHEEKYDGSNSFHPSGDYWYTIERVNE